MSPRARVARWIWPLSALGVALLGCGGRTSLDNTASSAPPFPIDDAGGAADAGTPSGLPAGPLYGLVVAQTTNESGVQSSASAEFFVDENPTCALAGAPGECSLATCSSAQTSLGIGAGLISIDGGSQPALLAPRIPTALDGVAYESWNGVGAAFLPDQLLAFSADGTNDGRAEASVPPFRGDLRFPENLMVREPSTAGGPGAILLVAEDGGTDFELAWTPGSTDEVLFFMRSPIRGGQRPQLLTCFFQNALGRGTVPSRLFNSMRSGPGAYPTGLVPIARKAVHVEAGGTKWAIELAAVGQGAEGEIPVAQFR